MTRSSTAVERYYSGRFAEHGPTAEGVDWNSDESQELRFEQLAQLFADADGPFSVIDFGCGYGAFASFLGAAGYDARYVRLRRSRRHARACPRRVSATTRRRRFVSGRDELEPADYSVASGIFNVSSASTTTSGERTSTTTLDTTRAR